MVDLAARVLARGAVAGARSLATPRMSLRVGRPTANYTAAPSSDISRSLSNATALKRSSSVWASSTLLTQRQSRWRGAVSRGADSATRSGFHSTATASHGGIERPEPGKGIKITFRDSKGSDLKTVEANEGDDLLSIAHEYDIDLEGACEGSIACSTCHVILQPEVYDKLEEPGDDENDMLDLAFGLTDTSRLGCQVKVTRDLDGMVAQLPSATRNMYVDGAKGGHGH